MGHSPKRTKSDGVLYHRSLSGRLLLSSPVVLEGSVPQEDYVAAAFHD